MEQIGPVTRRTFAAAATAFTIVPRHVLGQGQVAPSDRVNIASIGLGRQGMVVTMDLLARPDVQITAVCDCNKGSKEYAEYNSNALLTSARQLLGTGYENWGDDLASSGSVNAVGGVAAGAAHEVARVQTANGWTFPWASSFGSDFNFDFSVGFTEEQQRRVGIEYNYRREARLQAREGSESRDEGAVVFAAMSGTDPARYTRERPGMSGFALEDGVVHHTYSTYARGLDGLWGMYQWLDRAPRGRNETGVWWRRHDEYNKR